MGPQKNNVHIRKTNVLYVFLVIVQALKKRSEYPQVETGCTLDNYMGQLETMIFIANPSWLQTCIVLQ